MNLTYLASPYTPLGEGDDREQRFLAACKAAAKLMLEGRVVFCPIAHSHPIEQFFPSKGAGPFWERQDAPYLTFCTELVVLCLPGWEKSSGVRHEIEVAQFRKIPISYIDP
jgi:hypothetical protein